jgi:hypothetical protein
MNPPLTPASALDRFAEDIRHDGDGQVFHHPPRGFRARLAALPFSWLVFPLVGWLISRGLLRMVLALGFAAAPALAVGFILWDAWSLWRARRRSDANPG